jgi:hypothetical protein
MSTLVPPRSWTVLRSAGRLIVRCFTAENAWFWAYGLGYPYPLPMIPARRTSEPREGR